MTVLADVEHFAGPPGWTWYILFYFLFAGLSGGSYVIASLFRLRGEPSDEPAARLGYYVSFAALIPCPVMLILDLGTPLRFWHMLWNTTPGAAGLVFKWWSPMSVGAWALLVFGAFATASFVDSLVRDGRLRWRWVARLLGGVFGRLVMVVGTFLPRPIRRRLHRRAAIRDEPAGVERHVDARRAVPRLRHVRLDRAAADSLALPHIDGCQCRPADCLRTPLRSSS